MDFRTPNVQKRRDAVVLPLAKHPENPSLWNDEILLRLNEFMGDVDTFHKVFVPCNEPCPVPSRKEAIYGAFLPLVGIRNELEMYDPLIQGLDLITSEFPNNKPLEFRNTSRTDFHFPFARWDPQHHITRPDVVALVPNTSPDSTELDKWRNVSLVFEVKAKESEDPVLSSSSSSEEHARTRIQLAKNVRNLMFAHNNLYCFVVGIYEQIARIFRFDRVSAIASPPIPYRTDPTKLREFLWHFVHPAYGNGVNGMDKLSVRATGSCVHWTQDLFDSHGQPLTAEDLEHNHLVTIPPMTVVKPNLFGRCTVVQEVVRKSDEGADVTRCIMKESWRQDIWTSELEFYECIKERIKLLEKHAAQGGEKFELVGLARIVRGVDLSTLEMSKLERRTGRMPSALFGSYCPEDTNLQSSSLSKAITMLLPHPPQTPPPKKRQADPPKAVLVGAASQESISLLDAVTTLSQSPTLLDNKATTFLLPQASAVPVVVPDSTYHHTMSGLVRNSDLGMTTEWNQMHLILDIIGLPIDDFCQTKEMVLAIHDAMTGHQFAYESGILHRDVSHGNIMIAEGKPFKEFILDFDYSSFWMDAQAKKNLVPAIIGAIMEACRWYGDHLFEEGDSARTTIPHVSNNVMYDIRKSTSFWECLGMLAISKPVLILESCLGAGLGL
ncbi:hypothetical protein SCP_1503240 [Sparassis crispa]|uniref:Fungal-type protein kinase domain-containing protein n=1 Tax=Sparassis crispa TaxID=139825 RepID=A0A401H4E3_9APHY|nr:hypothetical protein SCP_1503240 [Sparassis crispa]GBE89316.1 hypothetical protein SCP_1503240 [Sparassis crispa]